MTRIPAFRVAVILAGGAFIGWPSVSWADSGLDAIVLGKLLQDTSSAVTNALKAQKEDVAKQQQVVEKWGKNEASEKRKAQLQATQSVLTKTEEAVNGNAPHSLRETITVAETIAAIKQPVYVACNSNLWVVQDARYEANWKPYVDKVALQLAEIAGSVGMFVRYSDLPADGQLHWRGNGATAFVIEGPYVVTNRHVLKTYAFEDTTGWHLVEHQVLKVQFPHEYESCTPRKSPREFTVTDIIAVGKGPSDDYAILKIDRGNLALPPQVPVAATPNFNGGAFVVAIGYPERPLSCGNSMPTPDQPCTFLTAPQVDQLFGAPDGSAPFPAERVSPGAILANPMSGPDQFSYNSSTWGGNSGSPVVRLSDSNVVGLQVQGVSASDTGEGFNNGISIGKVVAALGAWKAQAGVATAAAQ